MNAPKSTQKDTRSSFHQQQTSVGLSPQGTLYCLPESNTLIPRRIREKLEQSTALGLVQLGIAELATELPPDLSFFREFARLFFTHFCAQPGISEMKASDLERAQTKTENSSLTSIQPIHLMPKDFENLALSAPPMLGLEYLSAELLAQFWKDLYSEFIHQLAESQLNVQDFFESQGAAWNLVGRVCFHLAENKENPKEPFAFLATYSHRLSNKGKLQHLPLGKALQEYAGEKKKSQLLQLLLPIQKASQSSAFLKELVESREIFHPLAWNPEEAFQFLKDIPTFESAGVIVRVPNWWKAKKPPRPQVSVHIGDSKASRLGMDALLKFSVNLTLEGETLTEKEFHQILSSTQGLVLIRGKWVEIDRDKLNQVLDHFKKVEKKTSQEGISFIEGMRLLSGATSFGLKNSSTTGTTDTNIDVDTDTDTDFDMDTVSDWSRITAGDWLSEQLNLLSNPDGKLKNDIDPGPELKATLRPYQRVGVQWLWLLYRLGLGGCLADDMGLGKTIQVISLFLLIKKEFQTKARKCIPNLLVVPASLIGNWKSEIERFAPNLRFHVLHPSFSKTTEDIISFNDNDIVITTYNYLNRLTWISEKQWNLVVIDEAQAIKNSGTKQTKAVKSLQSQHRIALTGTPIENRLSDLWSLYDFLCPGLLGTAKEFEAFVKAAEKKQSAGAFAGLRNLIRPYLLRRLKTDKSIINDLPDKTELQSFCGLTKKQAALYQQAVSDLADKIEFVDGIQRRGVVLSFLIRLKQICNHPSQWLGDGEYQPNDSGKFSRLRELGEEIAAKQEKVLVFTQFREMTEPIGRFLTEVFGREGLILHGETSIKKRKELVDQFQDHKLGPPFFVLSLKAGGTGLNLTAASHVIHFDRWWNPAIENQATDRAYRIGQRRNVLVHKFVCRGTIEERIDALLSSKQMLSNEILEGGTETILTELSNQELLKLVSLDLRSATQES